MKKILVFLGSPRKNGNTEKLAKAFAEGARENGAEVDFFRLSEKSIKPCVDCRKCWETGKPCVIEDDMYEAYKAIDDAEVLVFCSPVYWYAWSAQIKPLWDRLLPYCSDKAPKTLKNKGCVLIAAAGDVTRDVFNGMDFALEKSAGLLGMRILGGVRASGVYGPDDVENTGWPAQARELGKDCAK
ncbi:MAG TPA: flavodoxin family protein [Synergistaceae bacterium]|jgi:multimeric flavodoxin WrbA|nr:MAG: NADPH-dependent FMN reductase [Synergistales bacterium 53_16]KUL05290.1 MAG: NADPH-dependent FMN reductase [Synergistales bacterium 54_9]HAA47761.1 flavodoxin family protein [Synergistaceae bacterium]HAG22462.1 flavodoxin family protein [Synergistaceae bacterium]